MNFCHFCSKSYFAIMNFFLQNCMFYFWIVFRVFCFCFDICKIVFNVTTFLIAEVIEVYYPWEDQIKSKDDFKQKEDDFNLKDSISKGMFECFVSIYIFFIVFFHKNIVLKLKRLNRKNIYLLQRICLRRTFQHLKIIL